MSNWAELQKIVVKKKFASTVGQINLNKNHPLLKGTRNGMAITPLLQSHYLKLASEMVPQKVCDTLNTILGFEEAANNSQAYRLIHQYGESEEMNEELRKPRTTNELETVETPVESTAKQEVIYGMFDGGHFPYDDGFKEVKIGRIFRGSQIEQRTQVVENESSTTKNRVLNSEYLMREGHYEAFTEAFGELLDAHQKEQEDAQLVFITDGATWMRNWISQKYPTAVSILDFYHAYEHLCEFGVHVWQNPKERAEQLDLLKGKLRDGKVEQIIEQIQIYCDDTQATIRKEAEQLLTYLTNNKDRMQYDKYRKKGYLIGSGAIESAVKSVAQQRCKLSGQRWGNGLQPVLNIRALYRSGKGNRMKKMILNNFTKAA